MLLTCHQTALHNVHIYNSSVLNFFYGTSFLCKKPVVLFFVDQMLFYLICNKNYIDLLIPFCNFSF